MNLTQFYKIKIKICPICEKPFKDNTRPKNKKYCSKKCKNINDANKIYEKSKNKSLANGDLAKQKIKDKETINKRIFKQLLKEEERQLYPNEITLIKEFHQDDTKYGLGSAGNKLSEHPHSNFNREYELILETQLAMGLINENEYYNKLKKIENFSRDLLY